MPDTTRCPGSGKPMSSWCLNATYRGYPPSPSWALALLRHGAPKFANITPYVEGRPSLENTAGFVQKELKGTFTWEEIARMRRAWDGPLIAKGVLHPDDADAAVMAGVDGILVSNHGGRQSDAAPSPLGVLPAICERVNGRATILLDSGVLSGLDAARAIALGGLSGLLRTRLSLRARRPGRRRRHAFLRTDQGGTGGRHGPVRRLERGGTVPCHL